MELSRFEKRCLALTDSYDHDVCDGKYCQWKLTCLRYMLHVRAEFEGHNPKCLYYIQRKFDYEHCYLKYESRIDRRR